MITPPFPAEAMTVSGFHQMTPNLPQHPLFDIPKTPGCATYGKVIHPAPQNGVNTIYNPLNGLGPEPPESLFELTCKRFPLRYLGNGQRSPFPFAAAYPLERKSQEPKSLPLCQIHSPALFRVDFDLNVSKFLSKPFHHSLLQPTVSRVPVN